MIMYLYFFISHANSKAFKYVLSLIRQFNCEIIRTNQKVNARPLKADIRTPACRDPCLSHSTGQAGSSCSDTTSLLTLQGLRFRSPQRCGVPRDAISAAEKGELFPRHVTTDAPRGFASGSPPTLWRPPRCDRELIGRGDLILKSENERLIPKSENERRIPEPENGRYRTGSGGGCTARIKGQDRNENYRRRVYRRRRETGGIRGRQGPARSSRSALQARSHASLPRT